jgi:hypothetical protein
VWWWWCGGGGFFTDYNTTPTKVVLSCFGLLVGLWQYRIKSPILLIIVQQISMTQKAED